MTRYFTLFKQTFTEFSQDKVPRLGAALAYYTIFSIAPLLLVAIAIAGLVFGQKAAQGQVFDQLKGVFGPEASKSIQEMVRNAAKPKSGTIATILGIITLLLGASGVFGQLEDALNTIWDVEPKKSAGILGLIKDRFLSLAMVFGIGFLLLVSLLFDAAVAALGKFAGSKLPGGEALWHVVELVISFGLVTVLFALMFRFLPDLKIEWRDVWFGAALTSLLFVLGKFALGIYFGKSAVGSAYGAAGSLVLLLLWVYYSAQIFLFGAEFTQVYARTHGSRVEEKKEEHEAPRLESHALQPVIVYRTQKAGGGTAKLAVGGIGGLFFGALLGGIGTVAMVIKSVRRLLS